MLVANRGEIAVRIIATLRRLGVRAAAVHSDADRDAPHVRAADVAVPIGPAPAADSYLRIDRLVEAAHTVGADAVHPGYGFVSENPAFARACADAGLVFVGPPPAAIEAMGDKITARRTVAAAGVPVVPGSDAAGLSDEELRAAALDIGLPVLIKPSAGGGGTGMRRVDHADDLAAAIAAARREAAAAFGDDTLFVERFVDRPRHVEVQVLCDHHGGAIHLGERECSLQRRHQKIVEEAPSPLLTDRQRAAYGELAVAAARACGYTNAGTVELIVSADRPDEPFFMEMNTRLQVEHPVTEMVWGVDLVELQLRVAAGEPLDHVIPADLAPRGHAVEARLYAEDPAHGFVPSPGRIAALVLPVTGDGVRVDAGIVAGQEVGTHYDPLLAKVIAHGADRAAALARLDAALAEVHVAGLVTNAGFLRDLLAVRQVRAGALDTGLVDRFVAGDPELAGPDAPDGVVTGGDAFDEAAIAAALAVVAERARGVSRHDPWSRVDGWRVGDRAWAAWRAAIDGRSVTVRTRGEPPDVEVLVGDEDGGAVGDEDDPAGETDWPGGDRGEPVACRVHDAPAGRLDLTIGGRRFTGHATRVGGELWVTRAGHTWRVVEHAPVRAGRDRPAAADGTVRSPMPGTVVSVTVAVGDRVREGQVVAAVEAMKMEHALRSPADGVVAEVAAAAGDRVALGATLVVVEPAGAGEEASQ